MNKKPVFRPESTQFTKRSTAPQLARPERIGLIIDISHGRRNISAAVQGNPTDANTRLVFPNAAGLTTLTSRSRASSLILSNYITLTSYRWQRRILHFLHPPYASAYQGRSPLKAETLTLASLSTWASIIVYRRAGGGNRCQPVS